MWSAVIAIKLMGIWILVHSNVGLPSQEETRIEVWVRVYVLGFIWDHLFLFYITPSLHIYIVIKYRWFYATLVWLPLLTINNGVSLYPVSMERSCVRLDKSIWAHLPLPPSVMWGHPSEVPGSYPKIWQCFGYMDSMHCFFCISVHLHMVMLACGRGWH